MAMLEITVNGLPYRVEVGLKTTLVAVLRDKLGVTSPKVGCNSGDCGACSILLNGKLVKSCITNALTCQGKEVMTIEGLVKPGEVHPLQKAFFEHYGAQCGFCTPAMILAAKALLDENPNPTRENVKEALSGNLCRCTGYVKIINSVMAAAEEMAAQKAG
ncbi:MAG: (2Fe-2S)-binding protein [Proteobacteria bacterium]|nr:(2Fe-2S)-binding protein [Pseudomonadota bacterium]